jgi:hypothetical protein
MKKILLIIFMVIPIISCSTQKLSNEVIDKDLNRQEKLRISAHLVLPHYLPKSGALSREIIEVDEPKGLRVVYLAPRLISSSISVQTLNEFSSEEKTITAQAKYFAEANVLNLRKQGISNTLFLKESINSKFSNTDVAYQRVIREDTNRVLHLYVTRFYENIIFIQAWSDYKKDSEGYKERFDTFVYHLILDLESQIQPKD